ncbi:hypothetical protein HG531_001121 [Fusarium graminearum]|nr:hypothetical protein HG531_001121 [Fusarium graminearum]
MHFGSAPAAMFALQAAAHDANSAKTASALECGSDLIKVLGDLFDSILRDVVTKEGSTRECAVDLSEETHESHRFALVCFTCCNKPLEVVVVYLLLGREISTDGFIREEAIKSSAVFGMRSSLEEDPCAWSKESLCHWNDAWLHERRGLEDLVCDISIGSEDNEPSVVQLVLVVTWDGRLDLLVKDRYTTQGTASPLGEVCVEFGVKCLDEWSHEGDLECWASYGTFPPDIHELVVCYEDSKDGDSNLSFAASFEPTREEAILLR